MQNSSKKWHWTKSFLSSDKLDPFLTSSPKNITESRWRSISQTHFVKNTSGPSRTKTQKNILLTILSFLTQCQIYVDIVLDMSPVLLFHFFSEKKKEFSIDRFQLSPSTFVLYLFNISSWLLCRNIGHKYEALFSNCPAKPVSASVGLSILTWTPEGSCIAHTHIYYVPSSPHPISPFLESKNPLAVFSHFEQKKLAGLVWHNQLKILLEKERKKKKNRKNKEGKGHTTTLLPADSQPGTRPALFRFLSLNIRRSANLTEF